jgi:GNAT superfamily N-acetyltransferase
LKCSIIGWPLSDLAGDLQTLVARGHCGEGDAGVHHIFLDAVETPEEVEMPPRAAEFAIGNRLQTDLFLLAYDAFDLAVLDRFQRRGIDRALGELGARVPQRRRAQQAADMIGAERRRGALGHGGFSL